MKICVLAFWVLVLASAAQAQFTYSTNVGTITITGYTGSDAYVIIPDSINGYPVTAIGYAAFSGCSLAKISMPNSLNTIDVNSFNSCSQLTSVVIPNNVTSIGEMAFANCPALTNVILGSSLADLGPFAFLNCQALRAAYFLGNYPSVEDSGDDMEYSVFLDESGTVYYWPGTSGWNSTFAGWPTALWYQAPPQTSGTLVGLTVQKNQLELNISWAANGVIVVESCTNLSKPEWTPLATNVLLNGVASISDPNWTNYPSRFYRVTWP